MFVSVVRWCQVYNPTPMAWSSSHVPGRSSNSQPMCEGFGETKLMVLRQPVDAEEAVGSGSFLVTVWSCHVKPRSSFPCLMVTMISMSSHNYHDHRSHEEGHDETSERFPSKKVSWSWTHTSFKACCLQYGSRREDVRVQRKAPIWWATPTRSWGLTILESYETHASKLSG